LFLVYRLSTIFRTKETRMQIYMARKVAIGFNIRQARHVGFNYLL
jgi:hypothetical protein